jgi:hypothetical protein
MRLRHPSFSGSWAPDYGPVRDLLRNRLAPFNVSPAVCEEVRLQQMIHDAVAGRLVPDGKSLLQRSTVRRPDMRLLHVLYDNYFLTLRGPVSHGAIVAQLLRRLTAIVQDVATNTLHPPGPDDAELRQAEDAACPDGVTASVAQVADCAVGPTQRPADAQRTTAGARQ